MTKMIDIQHLKKTFGENRVPAKLDSQFLVDDPAD